MEGTMAATRIPIPEWAKTPKTDNRLELSLSEVDLVVRTVNCLEDHGIFTVEDLLTSTPKQLLEIPNLGEKTLDTIYLALEKIGFYRPGTSARDAGVGPVATQELCPVGRLNLRAASWKSHHESISSRKPALGLILGLAIFTLCSRGSAGRLDPLPRTRL